MTDLEDEAIADQCAKLREEAAALDAQVRGIKLDSPQNGERAVSLAFEAANKRKLAKRLEQRAQDAAQ